MSCVFPWFFKVYLSYSVTIFLWFYWWANGLDGHRPEKEPHINRKSLSKWGMIVPLGFAAQKSDLKTYWLRFFPYKLLYKQARKPRSYASSKLWLSDLLIGVKCRASTVAKYEGGHSDPKNFRGNLHPHGWMFFQTSSQNLQIWIHASA